MNVCGDIREIEFVPREKVVNLPETISSPFIPDKRQGVLLKGHHTFPVALSVKKSGVNELDCPCEDCCCRIGWIVIGHKAETFDKKIEDWVQLRRAHGESSSKLFQCDVLYFQIINASGQ